MAATSKASITGGTIAGNTNQDGQDTAIQLTDMNEKYIVLELGGTANITGEILIMDNYDVGPYILVTSDLQVKRPSRFAPFTTTRTFL